MALVLSIDFNTSPILNPFQGLNCLDEDRQSNHFAPAEENAFHFQRGCVTPVLPVSSVLHDILELEPVPIGAYMNPCHQAHLQSMLKESVDFLFGSTSHCEEGISKKRKMFDGGVCKKRRKSGCSDVSDPFSCDSSLSSESSGSEVSRFRPYQNLQWCQRFEDLKEFRRLNGNCSVPYNHPPNPSLARWVKRQRYQYKLFTKGQASAMTEERIQMLEDTGFVWEAYMACWERRMGELRAFRAQHGHCNVPTSYKANKKLAVWVKFQRMQYKLFNEGRPSVFNIRRIDDLVRMGFQWEDHGIRLLDL